MIVQFLCHFKSIFREIHSQIIILLTAGRTSIIFLTLKARPVGVLGLAHLHHFGLIRTDHVTYRRYMFMLVVSIPRNTTVSGSLPSLSERATSSGPSATTRAYSIW